MPRPRNSPTKHSRRKSPYLDGLCIFRKGRYIAGYANLPDAAEAAAKAGTLVARIP